MWYFSIFVKFQNWLFINWQIFYFPYTVLCIFYGKFINSSWFHTIGLAKNFIWVFDKMAQENPDELFGQSNILLNYLIVIGR